MSVDLFAEFAAAVGETRASDFGRLEAMGVSREFMIMGPARFGCAVIEPTSAGAFEIGDSGELAIVQPAIPLPAGDDEIGDLIAWRPSHPAKWWMRHGVVPLLNPDAVLRAEIMREPLLIFSTPLEWLRAGGQGTVILDWSVNLSLQLGGIDRIIPDARALGDALEKRLRIKTPPAPQIVWRAA